MKNFQETVIPIERLISLLEQLPDDSYVSAIRGQLIIVRHHPGEFVEWVPTHCIDIDYETLEAL